MPQQNTTNPDLGHNFVHPEPIIGHINKRSKLKKILIFLVALILLGGIAIAVWYFTGAKKTNQSTADTSVQTTQTVQKEETASATLYTAKLAGFSLDNKYNWKVTETDNQATATDSTAGDVVDIVDEFILNDKQKLIFNLNSGGRGGDCEPKAKDVAFAAGNDCASYKLLTAEKLPESSYPSAKRFSDRLNAYVVTYQLRLPLQNDTTFTLAGIESSTQNTDGSEVPLELNKPIMGAYSPLTILPLAKDKGSIYVKIVDNDGNPTQLSDADLQKVVEVLKTFKLI